MRYYLPRRELLRMTGAVAALPALRLAGLPSLCPAVLGTPHGETKKPTRICIFSKHLQWLDYQGMVQTAADIGFDGVDLTVRPGGHVWPERVEEDLPKAVQAVRAAGLDVPMITTAVTDPDDALTARILATASKEGCLLSNGLLSISGFQEHSTDFERSQAHAP